MLLIEKMRSWENEKICTALVRRVLPSTDTCNRPDD
jgi:hypothetical protein